MIWIAGHFTILLSWSIFLSTNAITNLKIHFYLLNLWFSIWFCILIYKFNFDFEAEEEFIVGDERRGEEKITAGSIELRNSISDWYSARSAIICSSSRSSKWEILIFWSQDEVLIWLFGRLQVELIINELFGWIVDVFFWLLEAAFIKFPEQLFIFKGNCSYHRY